MNMLHNVKACPTNAKGNPQHMAKCPAHDDRKQSLAVSCDRDGRILLCCHAGCSTQSVVAALGLTMSDLAPPKPRGSPRREAEYIYKDADGNAILRKVKLRNSDGSKSFFWEHREGTAWKAGRAGVSPPLFGLQSLRGETVAFVVEGEKDVLTMHQFGFPCVSLPDGAASKWSGDFGKALAGLVIYIVPDNDAAGREYAEMVAKNLNGVARSVAVLDLTTVWPGMPAKADISDYVQKVGLETACKSVSDLAQAANAWCIVRPSDLSDAGNAEVFAKQVRGRLLWCDALGWLVWDGKRWDPNEHAATGLAITFAQQMLDDALTRFKDSMDPETGKATDEAKRYLAHAQRTRSATSLQHFLGLSKAWLHVKAAELDADWYLLNTDAGLVDLRTGEVRPHDPAALCTKIAPFSPSAAGAPMWSEFLATITDGDAELERYLQIKVGSYAFGKIHFEGVDFAVGGGRNGKSTLYNALGRVLGDYAGGIDSTILTTDKQNRGAALATLRGKRLVTCGELEEGQRLSVQTLKRIASTDPLTIEEKYRQPETITPSHHVVLFSNFLPRVGSTDNGTWRRISVIPFSATMPEGDADIPNYADVLATQAGGAILAWIIEGAKLFHRARYHVSPPATVVTATDRYKQREDWLELFLAERCIIERDAKVKGGELYGEYKNFAQATGDYCRRGNDFTKAMEERGFVRILANGRSYWRGIRIDYAQDYGEPPPQFGYV